MIVNTRTPQVHILLQEPNITNHKSRIKSHQQKMRNLKVPKGIFGEKRASKCHSEIPHLPPAGPVGAPGGGTEFVSAGAAQRGREDLSQAVRLMAENPIPNHLGMVLEPPVNNGDI